MSRIISWNFSGGGYSLISKKDGTVRLAFTDLFVDVVYPKETNASTHELWERFYVTLDVVFEEKDSQSLYVTTGEHSHHVSLDHFFAEILGFHISQRNHKEIVEIEQELVLYAKETADKFLSWQCSQQMESLHSL